MVWPTKFRPDLPPRYDDTLNPVEFLQLYTVGIQAAGGDDRVMANWFPMALKDVALSWLMNLPEGSNKSKVELCVRFVTNFKGMYERPLSLNDLRAVKQRKDEMLRKYIQRFSQVCNRIPRITDAAVIGAFSAGVTDSKIHEKLGIYAHSLTSVVLLFHLPDKCTKAEEVRLFANNCSKPEDPDEAKTKSKNKEPAKRKAPAVLAAESEPEHGQKLKHGGEEDNRKGGKYCTFHKLRTHNTEDYIELKKIRNN